MTVQGTNNSNRLMVYQYNVIIMLSRAKINAFLLELQTCDLHQQLNLESLTTRGGVGGGLISPKTFALFFTIQKRRISAYVRQILN